MVSGLTILAIGFVLGMRHATDPDHVIAVSTIVSRELSISKAARVGILWGCGHTLTIFAVGGAIILFGLSIPTRVGLSMEFSVGLMLVVLGVLNLSGAMNWLTQKFSPTHPTVTGEHAHVHEHGERVHFHWHTHRAGNEHHADSFSVPEPVVRPFDLRALRPLFIGIVHGLAGSAAVALLVLSAIRDPQWAVLYLSVFGVGTIAGMMLITAAIALPFSFGATRFAWLNRGLITTSGLLSLSFGLFVCYRIGFASGLFTAHAHWTPN
ncbi:MAG: hypothetical protein NVS9B4_21300 [Candidatus Acidiferrum sp.]